MPRTNSATWNLQQKGFALPSLADTAWIIFLLAATLSEPFWGTTPPSKPFWFGAYFFIVYTVVKKHNLIINAVRNNLLIVAWPVLACLSAIWSLIPEQSLYEGIQLLMTVLLGLLFALTVRPEKATLLIFYALLIGTVLSLICYKVYPSQAIGWTGEFRGIYHHKNEMGIYSALLVLLSVCFLVNNTHKALAIPGLVFGALALFLTHAGTPTISVSAAMALVLLLVTFRMNSSVIQFIFGSAIIVLAVASAYIILNEIDIVSLLLGGVGKDTTLTGRTVLWNFAYEAIGQRPWLGFGFKGWWTESNPAVQSLRLTIGQDLWYFHNVYLETLVAFGVVGFTLFILTIIVAIRRSIVRYAAHPDAAGMWNLLYLLMLMIYATAENPIFLNHSIHQFLLTVAFATGSLPNHQYEYGRAGSRASSYAADYN